MADVDGVSLAVGLQKRSGKEGFIVFDTDLVQEKPAGEQKEEASDGCRNSVEQGVELRFWFAGRIQL
jgi:hypothetical protein